MQYKKNAADFCCYIEIAGKKKNKDSLFGRLQQFI